MFERGTYTQHPAQIQWSESEKPLNAAPDALGYRLAFWPLERVAGMMKFYLRAISAEERKKFLRLVERSVREMSPPGETNLILFRSK